MHFGRLDGPFEMSLLASHVLQLGAFRRNVLVKSMTDLAILAHLLKLVFASRILPGPF